MPNFGDRMESEAQEGSMSRLTNDMMVCRDCVYRWDDSVKWGNATACDRYPLHNKPSVVKAGGNCRYYQKEA